MGIITEGMKYRKKICDYAVKSGNCVAVNTLHTILE